MKLFSRKNRSNRVRRSAQAVGGLPPLESRRMMAPLFPAMNDPFVDETLMVTDADLVGLGSSMGAMTEANGRPCLNVGPTSH